MAYGKSLFTSSATTGKFIVTDDGASKPVRKRTKFHFPSLGDEKRTHVGTACAAHWLDRKQQTLRGWACFEDGPIRPVRINGRLAWPVDEIRHLMGVERAQ